MEYNTLVLPGGGSKGYAILGAIQACIDLGRLNLAKIHTYVGTSIGTVIGYLLAIGYTPMELIVWLSLNNKWVEGLKFYDLVKFSQGDGALSFTPIMEALEKLTLEKIGYFLTLSKLSTDFGKNLICTAYNTTICTTEYLSTDTYPDMPCLTALRISCNIPLIFPRYKYLGNYYIDGGITDNFPIKKACSRDDTPETKSSVLGINLRFSEKSLKDEPSEGIVLYVFRLLQTPIVQASYERLAGIDSCTSPCIISIDSGDYNPINFNITQRAKLEMFSAGYTSVKEYYKGVENSNTEPPPSEPTPSVHNVDPANP